MIAMNFSPYNKMKPGFIFIKLIIDGQGECREDQKTTLVHYLASHVRDDY